jgi:betaine reductase
VFLFIKHKRELFFKKNLTKGEGIMKNWLEGKLAIVIGERDGVQGPSIAACLEAAGADVTYAVTECFV